MNCLIRIFLLSYFSLLFALSGFCCINEYRVSLYGNVYMGEGEHAAPAGRFQEGDKSVLLHKLYEADSLYKASGKLEDYSDYGAMLLYNGRYAEGMQVFRDIEKMQPGLYATAANMGTAYELLGQNDSALYWIERALRINAAAHEGSEWIHLNILEAKVKSKGNASYFKDHPVLSLDFGNAEIPVNRTGRDIDSLQRQLYLQLTERMTFIKPQDAIVAQLLFDLGNVNAIAWDVKSALDVYEVARGYGYTGPVLERREQYLKYLQKKADRRNALRNWAKQNQGLAISFSMVAFMLFLAGIVLFVRWYRKRKRHLEQTN